MVRQMSAHEIIQGQARRAGAAAVPMMDSTLDQYGRARRIGSIYSLLLISSSFSSLSCID